MTHPILYISISHKHFLQFLSENQLSKHNYKYINHPDGLYEVARGSILILGHMARERRNISHVLDLAKARDMQIMDEREFLNHLANLNVTPGNQSPRQ